MKANIGAIDRVTRLIVALIFVAFTLTDVIVGLVGTVLVSLAIILALTATFKYCPIYSLFRITSCDAKKTE